MSRYQIIAQSDHRTVVAEFKPRPKLDTGFQSEQQLETHLIDILKNELKYEHINIIIISIHLLSMRSWL